MIVLIDNYDSFAHNLARYLRRLGPTVHVVRNDKTTVSEIDHLKPDAIVISPGPCGPVDAGCCVEVVDQLHTRFPILGICLGHQIIAHALGGRVVRAVEPVHGRSSSISHNQVGVFSGLPNPLRVGRYHSLIVDRNDLSEHLEVTAWQDDATVMAIQHRTLPIVGWQFHPESVLTECGFSLLAAFLELAKISVEQPLPTMDDEVEGNPIGDRDWFQQSISFP